MFIMMLVGRIFTGTAIGSSRSKFVFGFVVRKLVFYVLCPTKLTHTSNAKCFRNVTLIKTRGLAVISVPFRGYGRLSPNQVIIKRE